MWIPAVLRILDSLEKRKSDNQCSRSIIDVVTPDDFDQRPGDDFVVAKFQRPVKDITKKKIGALVSGWKMSKFAS